ncbi:MULTISPECIES: hypothetical protein [unclassified Synechococcus]|nr:MULTISPECIES: hypothetical protein [unclassified Synechococcus]
MGFCLPASPTRASAMVDLITTIVVDLSDRKLYAYNHQQQLV